MKNIFSSIALLVFALLLVIMQAGAAPANENQQQATTNSVAEASNQVSPQDYEQYYAHPADYVYPAQGRFFPPTFPPFPPFPPPPTFPPFPPFPPTPFPFPFPPGRRW